MIDKNLIVMLTWHDVTVANAKELFLECRGAAATHWGFKIEGTTPESMAELIGLMKQAGKRTYIEVLAIDEPTCLRSARLCARCGADHLLGTLYYESVHRVCKEAGIAYSPFVALDPDTRLRAPIGQVVEAVKSGAIRHFFLVGGCDGARPGRNYYTDFVKQAPEDTLILTLACGKYRFNDLELGTLTGIPRLLDMGQCNDAFGAIQVAAALAEAFGCQVNDLPLTLVLSWYEQKAVCILLSLLHLGIRNIYLGPTLPAFLSPAILEYLTEQFEIHPISTPENDLAAILA